MIRTQSAASLGALILLFSLTACTGATGSGVAPTAGSVGLGADADAMLAEFDIAAPTDVKDLIEELQAQPLTARPDGLMASVRVGELLLSSGDDEVSVPIPNDEFHLSVAPYLDATHDCYFHSLTTCVGELADEDLQVTITDDASGEVFLDDTVTTFDNGFFDIWLPSGRDLTMRIQDGENTAEVPVGTNADDPTCVTTVQLS
ncbi:CueP family metal-binding protein [Cryobacterium sp. SO2]|uniref:CueP family metal-binding protein n=1 Tax=Cryobacterium sp. SO2 TaxID=1897060 RepID=UPI00223D4B18|nr:CueP family metal-binding protein [Cryobacterium sp. SO2]WEO78290.1 CueP family metal-binding protein [Cryobacterium sp. SO2]